MAHIPAAKGWCAPSRSSAPYGLHGGTDGLPGRNTTSGPDGIVTERPAKGSMSLQDGETVTIQTPGGGGWGAPPQTRRAAG